MTDAFREPLGNDQHQITSLMTSWTSTTTTTTQPHPTRRRRGDVGQVDQNKTLIMNSNYSTTTTTKPQTQQQLPTDKTTCNRLRMSTKERTTRRRSPLAASYPTSPLVLVCLAALCLSASLQLGQADDSATRQQQQIDLRSTQPTLDRQLETPSSSSSGAGAGAAALAQAIPSPASSSPASVKPPTSSSETNRQHEQPRKLQKPIPSLASQKKAAALAAQRDYDKYQLKASSSSASSAAAAAAAPKVAASDSSSAAQSKPSSGQEKANGNNNGQTNNNKQAPEGSSSSTSAATQTLEPAHKKIGQLPNTRQPPKASASFSLLKKFFPSFMTSAAAVAATASAAAATSVDKQPHHNQHSRSSPTTSNSLLSSLLSSSSSGRSSSASDGSASASPSFALTGKIINLLSGALKKKGLPEGVSSAIPNHAPFFMRKSAVDRQAAGGGALALASGLLSNPLKLGLLFSAPLLPSLLLTPLAIAGLSPAMSAINNFFGDDDEPSSSSQSPLAALASGSSSPLASILQATGASPFSSASSSSSSDSSSSGSSSSSPGNSLALQAFQSFLGPTSTTERPLFNPGMFASSGIQNAAGAIGSALSAAAGSQSGGASSSSSGSFASSSNQRPSFFGSGGGLIQTAASMISPSFAAPPSSSGSSSNNANNNNNDDDGPGLMQMASGVFEKVANYMGNDGKDSNSIGQASGGSSATNSPLSTLASLSSMSPFQLSSLFASTPLGSAMGSPHVHSGSGSSSSSSGPIGNSNQRAGFFSTLRNIYELFSSSFLRRQEVGNENECQQRLICELHQRAMNSKLFRRSLQSNLAELANLDKNLIEQLKYSSQALQARVDPDTKAMLSDFLKATNNFKSGREMINCSQMFPKCSRTQLLAAANAHLSDPVNGRAIGKFSQLMKKMKFKSNQQHQSQWKLRKPGKSANVAGAQMAQAMRISPSLGVMQPATDYLQVAPLAPTAGAAQMAPVDSLKLAQQIMMMSQMNQQQQQPQAQASASSPAVAVSQYAPNGVISQQQQYRQSSSQQVPASYQPSAGMPQSSSYPSANSYISQYSPASKQQTTYTDAMVPTVQYSPTESPYFMQQPQASGSVGGAHQQQQQQQYLSSLGDQQQQQQQQSSYVGQQAQSQPMITNSQQQSAGQQQVASYPSDPSMPQQQQAGQNLDNKNKMQQLLTPGNSNASRPATAATAA